MKVKDMVIGQWYEGYGMQVECIGQSGLNADCLTTISLFWPLCLPDLLYRMIRGKWYSQSR